MLRCRRMPGAGASPEAPPSPADVARAASMKLRPCEMLAYRQVAQFLCEDTEIPMEYSGGVPASSSPSPPPDAAAVSAAPSKASSMLGAGQPEPAGPSSASDGLGPPAAAS